MAEVLNAAQQRAADLRELEQVIAEQEALVMGMWSAPPLPESAAAEQRQYDMFQEERYLNELKAQLEEMRKAPLVEERRTRGLPAKGLAIVVGHSAKGRDPGAEGKAFPPSVAGNMRYEVHWNEELAQLMLADARSRGIPCEIFRRDTAGGSGVQSAYRAVKDWGPRATVELHFNASNGAGHGTETLYATQACKAWAQKLQERMLAVYKPAAAAKGIQRSPAPWQDRKLQDRTAGGRGSLSLKQLDAATHGPSALIEPFFGDNAHDAPIAQETKQSLARALVDAYADLAGLATSAPKPADPPAVPVAGTGAGADTLAGGAGASSGQSIPAPPAGGAALAASMPGYFSKEFWELLQAYSRTAIEFPQLRAISFAQWALESGYGRGDPNRPASVALPRDHKNFGGQKYRPELAHLATPVKYTDWQGKEADYCSFKSYESFIKAYWMRFDLVPNYKGWRNHIATGEQFLAFIGPIYAPTSDGNRNYAEKVLSVQARLRKENLLPPTTAGGEIVVAGTGDTPAAPKPPAGGGTQPEPAPQPQTSGTPTGAPLPPPAATGGTEISDTHRQAITTLMSQVESTIAAARSAKGVAGLPAAFNAAADGVVNSGNRLIVEGRNALNPRALTALVAAAAPGADPLFVTLTEMLDGEASIERGARIGMLAQWALESDWGRSPLANVHYNLAGIEWDPALEQISGPVVYKGKQYCRFDGLARFLAAYRKKLDTLPAAAGWAGRKSAADFINLIASVWRPGQASYGGDVLKIASRLTGATPAGPAISGPATPIPVPGHVPAGGTSAADTSPAVDSGAPAGGATDTPPPPPPAQPSGTAAADASMPQGFVIHVKRERVEQNKVKGPRTVGTYRMLFNGVPIPGYEGMMFEQKGPGDNKVAGNGKRIEAGTYQLSTHQSGELTNGQPKYATHGYKSTPASKSLPKPGILVCDTNKRGGILLHPGVGWLSSVGCLNFSKPVEPNGLMDWGDSFTRTAGFIKVMQEKLGADFPARNAKRIPGAWLVVEGEPEGTSRSLLEARTRGVSGGFESASEISDELLERLRPAELFDLMADSINGQVLPGLVDKGLFLRALKVGGFMGGGWLGGLFGAAKILGELRGRQGETLWEAWAQGWQASQSIEDPAERARIQSELEQVARQLKSLNVDINAPGRFQTPLSAAATTDAGAAVAKLIALGADANRLDPMGNTPLITAAFFGAEAAVDALLAGGADPARKSRSEAERGSRRSIDGPPAEEEQFYAEAPPASATALEAAVASQRMLPQTDPDAPDTGVAELATAYQRIVQKLERSPGPPRPRR